MIYSFAGHYARHKGKKENMSQELNSKDTQRVKVNKIEVRRRPGSEGTLQTGATTQVFLDGKLLSGATFFKFEVGAKKVAKVVIEMYADVEIDADIHFDNPTVEETDLEIKGKPVYLHTLSSYSPKAVAVKKDTK
jgi:hypothetical protein